MKKIFVLGVMLFSWSAVSGEGKSSSKKESGKRDIASSIEIVEEGRIGDFNNENRIRYIRLSNGVTCYLYAKAYRRPRENNTIGRSHHPAVYNGGAAGLSCIKD